MVINRKSIKAVIILALLVLILTTVGCSSIMPRNNLLNKDPSGLGPRIYLTILDGGTSDYTVIERLKSWDESERNKLAKYMKDNNLRIVPGEYILNQRTPFETALKRFRFEAIE